MLHAWAQDPDTIRFNESRYPPSLQAMRPRAELHPTYDHARLAVVDRESGALVGDVALHTMDPESRSGFMGSSSARSTAAAGTGRMRRARSAGSAST